MSKSQDDTFLDIYDKNKPPHTRNFRALLYD